MWLPLRKVDEEGLVLIHLHDSPITKTEMKEVRLRHADAVTGG